MYARLSDFPGPAAAPRGRGRSLALAAPLSAEDQCVQSMPDASPTKWHLAHTSWFFEAVVLRAHAPAYGPFDERFFYLFNSYYEALGPRHRVLLAPCELADRLVTCGEYLRFVTDAGCRRPELWLSDGWAAVQAQGWQAPSRWLAPGDPRAPSPRWQVFGLQGVLPLDEHAPVSQLSFYDAAAYAQWAGARWPFPGSAWPAMPAEVAGGAA